MSDKLITEEIIDDTLSIDKVESDRQGALGENKEIYYGTDGTGGLIGDTNAAFDKAGSQFVIDPNDGFTSASEMQIANQNASYQQSVNEINQAKDQAQKDYTKEQTGSYVDYMKAIDPFGVNAEQMAAMGLSRSGYNENSQVQAYVAYQNRVAVARESFNKIILEYSNQMERARITNDSAIAQIYANSAQQLAALEIEKVAAVGQLIGQYQSAGNQIENPTIKKSQNITANVDAYLAQGDLDGAITYAENNKGEISTEEYQALYYNIALNSNVDASDIETNIDTITKWKNSGKLSAADARNLEAYYYSQVGTSGDKAGIKLGDQEKYQDSYYYSYKDGLYGAKDRRIESNTVSILNGIATGSGEKTPAHGTVVMYNGKRYIYDSFKERKGFLSLGGAVTTSEWRELVTTLLSENNLLTDDFTKYSNTHEVTIPKHSNNSSIMTEGTNSYAGNLDKNWKFVDLQRR